MNLRTTTRISALLGLVLAGLGAVALVASPTASAVTQERLVLGEDEVIEMEYGPLVGVNAAANVDGSTAINTDICSTVTYCDVIPLTVQEPASFSTDDAEYYVRVTLEWPSVVVDDVPVLGDTSATDLDLFIVNDPFVEDAGPDEDGFVYTAATSANPETFTMFQPAGDWNILVDNYASGPTFYTVTLEWLTSPLPTPFESLPPEFSSTGDLTPTPVKPSLSSPPPTMATPPAVFEPKAPAAPSLAPSAPPLADTAFDTGFDDGGGLADQLAAPPTTMLSFEPAATEEVASPSALALVLWLLALPLLFTAAVGWYLQRHRRAGIDF